MKIEFTFEELKQIHTMILMLSMATNKKFMNKTVRTINNKVINAMQELTK